MSLKLENEFRRRLTEQGERDAALRERDEAAAIVMQLRAAVTSVETEREAAVAQSDEIARELAGVRQGAEREQREQRGRRGGDQISAGARGPLGLVLQPLSRILAVPHVLRPVGGAGHADEARHHDYKLIKSLRVAN